MAADDGCSDNEGDACMPEGPEIRIEADRDPTVREFANHLERFGSV